MMAGIVDDIVTRARAAGKRIALPESEDPRVLEAAARLAADGVVEPILVGPAPASLPAGVRHVDPATSPRLDEYADIYLELTRHRGTGPEVAHRAAAEPLTHAALMVKSGEADGSVAGARHTTAETLRAALRIIRARALIMAIRHAVVVHVGVVIQTASANARLDFTFISRTTVTLVAKPVTVGVGHVARSIATEESPAGVQAINLCCAGAGHTKATRTQVDHAVLVATIARNRIPVVTLLASHDAAVTTNSGVALVG